MVTQNPSVRRIASSPVRLPRRGGGRGPCPSRTAVPRLAQRDVQMAKLDALPWAAGIAFVSCGVRLGVRVDDAAILDRLSPYLPPLREPTTAPEVDHLFSLRVRKTGERRSLPRLYEGSRLIRRGLDRAMQLDLLRSSVEFRIAANAPARIFVHAGVVEWRGRAIILPGPSQSGKTTLVTCLLRAGAKYYSDEFAVLDGCGRVYPWARPLRVRGQGLVRRSYPVESFGQRARQRSLPVGMIVVTTHRAGARWRPRPLSPGQALLALIRNTYVTRARPELTIRVLSRAVRGARALASRRGEADDLAVTLLSNPRADNPVEPTCDPRVAEGKVG